MNRGIRPRRVYSRGINSPESRPEGDIEQPPSSLLYTDSSANLEFSSRNVERSNSPRCISHTHVRTRVARVAIEGRAFLRDEPFEPKPHREFFVRGIEAKIGERRLNDVVERHNSSGDSGRAVVVLVIHEDTSCIHTRHVGKSGRRDRGLIGALYEFRLTAGEWIDSHRSRRDSPPAAVRNGERGTAAFSSRFSGGRRREKKKVAECDCPFGPQ